MKMYVIDNDNNRILAAFDTDDVDEKTIELFVDAVRQIYDGEIMISPTCVGCNYSSRRVGREIEKVVRQTLGTRRISK